MSVINCGMIISCGLVLEKILIPSSVLYQCKRKFPCVFRKCGTEKETSVHILCKCEALASLRHKYLGSFFLDPEDIRLLGVGAIWNFIKGTGLL